MKSVCQSGFGAVVLSLNSSAAFMTDVGRAGNQVTTGGLEALEDKASRPTRVWNRIPDATRERIVQLALDEPELSPRELATRFTDTANYFVSEASVYRLLKAIR